MKNTNNDPREQRNPQSIQDKKKQEAEIDEQLDQTFPASDPPSYSQPGNDLEKKKEEK